MDTKTFLKRVVAATDNIVICALKPGNTGNKKDDIFWNYANCNTLADAVKAVQEVDGRKDLTAYFAVGTHKGNTELKPDGKTKITRKQATAAWFKALCLDLDIGADKGSPYATQKDGLAALLAALKAFNFPTPMVVNSGKGIHCYWPLDNEISAAEWERTSKALRLALRANNVVVDESKIHDTSMVLRPAGSHHKKATPWVQVDVVADCPDYAIGALLAPLAQWIGQALPARPKSSTAPSARAMSPIMAAILSGDHEPLNLDAVIPQCPQLAYMDSVGGASMPDGSKVLEPFWRGILGVARYATDPQAAIVRLCGKFPGFDLQENLDKLARWNGTGVTTCDYFDKVNPAGCAGCAHKGQINSVAALNRLTSMTISQLVNDPDSTADAPATTKVDVVLPPNYFAANNRVYTEVEVEKVVKDAEGNKQTITVMEKQLVCKYPIVVLDSYQGDNYARTTVLWATKFPVGGWMSFELPADVLTGGGTDFTKYLGNKQLFMHEEALLVRTRKYMIDYLTHIQKHRPTGVDLKSFGWQADGSFLAGDKLIQRDASGASWRAVKTLQSLTKRIGSRGDRNTWVGMTAALNDPSAYHIGFSTLVAMSGVLLPSTGINSFVYSLWSIDTGTGKTIALLWGNSLFGHPTENLLTPRDTDNALFQIMGSLGSYSASMDEVTNMGPERAANFAFEAQSGREKISLNSNRELREGASWTSPLRVTTNTSMHALYDINKSKNDPEKVRTLEVRVDNKDFVQKHDVETMARELCDNYGHAAPEIAMEIIKRGGRRAVYEHYRAAFDITFPNFQFTKDERFYRAGIITSWAIGKIGEDLGLFLYDVNACTQWVLDRVVQLRTQRASGVVDAFDLVGQFLSDYNNQLVITREVVGSKPVVQMPIPDVAAARVELVFDKNDVLQVGSKLMINTGKLREWAKRTREDTNNLVYQLQGAGALLSDKERVTLFKGTHHANPGQAYCVVINLMHPRFAAAIASGKSIIPPSSPALALLQGGKP